MTALASRRVLPVRSSLLAAVVGLTACPGEQATTSETGSTTDEPATSTGDVDPTTTTGTTIGTTTLEPTSTGTSDAATGSSSSTGAPAVCGDGVVGEGEPCDDGNDEPDDGCSAKCERTGAVKWEIVLDGETEFDAFRDVAIDGAGRIVLAGVTEDAMQVNRALVLVLDAEGNELWRQTYDADSGLDGSLRGVAIDTVDNIFVVGSENVDDMNGQATLRKLAPDGAEVWKWVGPAPDAGEYADLQDVVIHAGAVYTVGSEGLADKGGQLTARRHNALNGTVAWTATLLPEGFDYAGATALAVRDEELVVVGRLQTKANVPSPLIATYDLDGAEKAVAIDTRETGTWYAVAVAAGGDLVLAGHRSENEEFFNYAVERVGPDGAVKWSHTFDDDFLYDVALAVAVGPGDEIVAGGYLTRQGETANALVQRFDPEGNLAWGSTYNNAADLDDIIEGAAFGPDYVVAVGMTFELGQDYNAWVRAYAIE